MTWIENINDKLPAKRGDEPESLRHDIADELADHLHCALRQELRSTTDETIAQQNVMNRFGNVKKIAYQLWFDALKEKIMSQRITLGLTAVLSVACLLMCWMVWGMNQQNQEATVSIQKELQALTGTVATIKDATTLQEMVPVNIQLVSDDLNKPLPKGYHVALRSLSQNIKGVVEISNVKATPDESGVVSISRLSSGMYLLDVVSPWGEQSMGTVVFVPPAKPFELQVTCPASPPMQSEITFSINLPDDLKKKNVWVVYDFWSNFAEPRLMKSEGQGKIKPLEFYPERRTRYSLSNDRPYTNGRTLVMNGLGQTVNFRGIYIDRSHGVSLPKELPDLQKSETHWTGNQYYLREIMIVTPEDKSLVLASSKLNSRFLHVVAQKTYGNTKTGGGFGEGDFAEEHQVNYDKLPKYTVDPDKQNHWKIELPESMIKEARKKLKELEKKTS